MNGGTDFMKRAIVLAGGGAKGSYQMGFWTAIRELGIDFQITTGSSVGRAERSSACKRQL